MLLSPIRHDSKEFRKINLHYDGSIAHYLSNSVLKCKLFQIPWCICCVEERNLTSLLCRLESTVPCVAAISTAETGSDWNGLTTVSDTASTGRPSPHSITDRLTTLHIHTPTVPSRPMALHLRETAILRTGGSEGSYQSTQLGLLAHAGTDGPARNTSTASHGTTASVAAKLSFRALSRPAHWCITHCWEIPGIGALTRNVRGLQVDHCIKATTAVLCIRMV